MLKFTFAKLEDIPEALRSFYKETGEGDKKVWTLEIEGAKSQADIDRQLAANQKERTEHAATKALLKEAQDKIKNFGDLSADDVQEKLTRLAVLETAAGGKLDEAKISQIVEGRIKQKTTPLERQIAKLTEERDAAVKTGQELDGKIKAGAIGDALRKAAVELKALPGAMDDIIALGSSQFEVKEDGSVVHKTTGVAAKDFINDMKASKPYFWPASQGAGSQGGSEGTSADNPWSAKNWNITAQGAAVQRLGATKAAEMAKQAGSALGAIEPPKAASAAA